MTPSDPNSNSVLQSIRQRRSKPPIVLPAQPDPFSTAPLPLSVQPEPTPAVDPPQVSSTPTANATFMAEQVQPERVSLPEVPPTLKDFRVRIEPDLYEQLRELCDEYRLDNSTLVESLFMVAQANPQFLEQVINTALAHQEKRDEDARLRYVHGLLSRNHPEEGKKQRTMSTHSKQRRR
ncbi:hypothetical protein BST81_09115 [Leptolyngbya sp. 'hensonii']|uniref:hypothetical protein n=1 Tax=Leptolyngbya sp. 'hensonii' TaxID=1922337 RepID=UPI0009500455|nr:hypothetical protein [Leptolyngbya sp. 'hensonii']OLP18732.1 hypothetical protein BST81_09115 [Leptolyngbya sp. 'hensonii']